MRLDPILSLDYSIFCDSFGLPKNEDPSQFEKFVNYQILSTFQPEAFSSGADLLEFMCVGGGNDLHIDGIGILVNDVFVKNSSEIDLLLKGKIKSQVNYIFIQTKMSFSFDLAEMIKYFHGIRQFFNSGITLPLNGGVTECLYLKNYLESESIIEKIRSVPILQVYYVALGKYQENDDFVTAIRQFKDDMTALNMFSGVECEIIDRDNLKRIIDNNSNHFKVTVNAIETVSLPKVESVSDALIALMYASEFVKILETDLGSIRRTLFEDNVRDFQGMNNVNQEILNTVVNDPDEFILLNNGVTIVCDDVLQKQRSLHITNPQIVNGCQTSHVIFEAKRKNHDLSRVPINVKIISTEDQETINKIVRGTNRQNYVLDEAFETTRKFHKELEDFTEALSSEMDKIFYERRSKQFVNHPLIKQYQKFNLRILTQSFVAMFFNAPHLSHRHEAKLLETYAGRIYKDGHSKYPYFLAAYLAHKLEAYFRKSNEAKYMTYKAHLLLIMKLLVNNNPPNLMQEKKMREYCENFLSKINDPTLFHQLMNETVTYFEKAINHWVNVLNHSPHSIKDREEFTQILLNQDVNTLGSHDQTDEWYHGRVLSVFKASGDNFYGFIEMKPDNIFFHSRQNPGLRQNNLTDKLVRFKISENQLDKRPEAIGIEII